MKGEVHLHRLNWQRVWSLSPPSDTSLVKSMAWRPDGKVIAIGYSCGTTYLIGVEDKDILDTIRPENGKDGTSKYGSVISLSWRSKPEEQNASKVHKNYVSFTHFVCKLFRYFFKCFMFSGCRGRIFVKSFGRFEL